MIHIPPPTSGNVLALADKYERILEDYITAHLYQQREKIACGLRHLAENPELITEEKIRIYNLFWFSIPSHPDCFSLKESDEDEENN